MSAATCTIDHAHVISPNPKATADWYVEHLGGKIARSAVVHEAEQHYIAFGDGAMVIVRGQRPGEAAYDRPGFQWGLDHFGMKVTGDFDGLCANLRAKGVKFLLEPTDVNPTTRIAFIQGPESVTIELLVRK